MVVAEGKRVYLRKADLNDAGFMLSLLNQRSFIDNIRDKEIKTHAQAQEHIAHAYLIPYQIGAPAPYIVVEASSNTCIGVCGLYQRAFLNYPDLGYAFIDRFTGKGYALEAAQALIEHSKSSGEYSKLTAITLESNTSSVKLLNKIGFNRLGKIIIDDKYKPVLAFEYRL
ncbi:GNAT family N-acetyltransferase [Pseudoalteromonas piscicida]|uniref:GNAT family N-acetyltransferase n=1 Tax=Pseudoalteromonas piscicida TaxID=43662 RepID=A0A2A5JTH5_PSEO7|nr:GNAT family N-acetyltransferase [Pseudoalteromonas piscicida]PCK32677.1 GNAT family N-acetyltransferase [Pseudoalteromonas piscicida]